MNLEDALETNLFNILIDKKGLRLGYYLNSIL